MIVHGFSIVMYKLLLSKEFLIKIVAKVCLFHLSREGDSSQTLTLFRRIDQVF